MQFHILVVTILLISITEGVLHKNVKRHIHEKPKVKDYSAIEAREVQSGSEKAAEGDQYILRDEPDLAAHSFAAGAEKLEAASNIAATLTGAGADQRHIAEHKLSRDLEDLVQQSINISADVDSTKPEPPAKSEPPTKPPSKPSESKDIKKEELKEKDDKKKSKGWLKPSDNPEEVDDDDDDEDEK